MTQHGEEAASRKRRRGSGSEEVAGLGGGGECVTSVLHSAGAVFACGLYAISRCTFEYTLYRLMQMGALKC